MTMGILIDDLKNPIQALEGFSEKNYMILAWKPVSSIEMNIPPEKRILNINGEPINSN